MLSRLRWLVVLPVALLLFAACATGSRSRQVKGEEAVVEVRNDLVPRSAVTIRMISSGGKRRLIGAVSPGQTKALRISDPAFRGSYYFVADVDAGGQIGSTRIVIEPGLKVLWMLRSNLLRVVEDANENRSPGTSQI